MNANEAQYLANCRRALLTSAVKVTNAEAAAIFRRDAGEIGDKLRAYGFDENGPTRRKLTWAEADIRVCRVFELRQRKYTQAQIASALKITRDLVAYYLTQSKARYRAQIEK